MSTHYRTSPHDKAKLLLMIILTIVCLTNDFVAIGDIVVDAFIELNKENADVSQDLDTGRKTLQMPFGSKLEYGDVTVVNAVGNSPNAV